MPRIVRSPSTLKSPPSTRTPVETKSIVGWVSASKKSPVRRCASRFGSLVVIEATSADAVTVESRGFSAVTKVASKRSNLPFTLLIMRWRMLKPTSLCAVSTFQVPAR